ncbi:MAG: site-specific integrase [Chloroflexota bacterium]|nr:MAG: site-specific integrase [Chloroflexota bacterium]
MARRGHGEGSIWKRDDGRWTGAVTLAGRKRKYFYGKTRKEVQEQLKVALRDQQRGLLVAGPSQTLAQYLNGWLEDSARQTIRPSTYECYALGIRRLAPHIGSLRLSALSPAHVQTCYSALLDSGLSRRSVELTHAVLHRALRQAMKWGLIGRNPTDAVSVPRPIRKEMRTLTAEQVQKLFEFTAEHRLHALWVLMATTGLRLGEATALRWEDIDLKTNRLIVQRALQKQKGKGLVFVEPKTERSRRTIHIAAGTVVVLRQHRARQVEERLKAGALWEDKDLAFCTETGAPLTQDMARSPFQTALRRAGLPSIRLHDLRHTAATLLLAQGVHPKVVQEMLGHSTITLTLDTYSHVIPALHAEAAAHMDRLFTLAGTKAP